MRSHFLLHRKFRASGCYQLAEWNQLNAQEQESLASFYDDEVYGIFRPSYIPSNLTIKVAYREVAFLWLHLCQSNQLPRYLTTSAKTDLNATIAQLVLDHILEIEYNGAFVTGAAAVHAVFGDTLSEPSIVPDHLSNLSMKGIQYAFMLHNLDVRSMANRLYSFNTLPYDASSKSYFNSSQKVKEFLIPRADDELHYLLNKHWNFSEEAEKKGWLFWSRRNAGLHIAEQQNTLTFKLYISPRLTDLRKVFRSSIPILSSSRVFGFKAGSTLPQLLRPDKMIVYFENRDWLDETFKMLEKELAGYAAQGVPYTKQLDESGLLSWGVDPPQTDDVSFASAESWRIKVTNELALAIIQAQEDKLALQQAVLFIRAKLSLAGIDTNDWAPIQDFFQPSS